jgi:hypothetical protein
MIMIEIYGLLYLVYFRQSFEKIPTSFVDLLALVSTHLKDHL